MHIFSPHFIVYQKASTMEEIFNHPVNVVTYLLVVG